MTPGFFGFSSYGAYNYFNGIKEILENRLWEEHGIKALARNCKTKPTASFTARARSAIEEAVAAKALDAPALHFVGHSTGGLDARLLLTPGVKLRKDNIGQKIAKKTLSLTTVSTPHFGTPIAGFLTTAQGKRVLGLLTALASNKKGRQGIYWSARAAKLVSEVDDFLGLNNTILDEIAKNFISKLTLRPEDPFWTYLKNIQEDQGALIQLTPEAMDLFNAAAVDRPNIDYRCVISATKTAKARQIVPKLRTPVLAGSMALFKLMQTITARAHKHYPYPVLNAKERDFLKDNLDFTVADKTNDGVSPTLSQIHGEIIAAAQADHMDIVGQFAREGKDQKYSDWLVSGSKFDEFKFKKIWETVADNIAASHTKKGP